MAGGFAGFGEDLVAFFEGLHADNSRAYWTDHRELYDRQVRDPLQALVADLEPEFGPGTLFRPYRDVRFSRDKSPYKTHAAAVLHHRDGAGSLYLHVDAEGLLVAGGFHTMARDQLARYRDAVAEARTGRPLVRAVADLEAAGWSRVGERLTRAPRGVPPDHPRIDLLRQKGLALSRRYPPEPWLLDAGARDVVAQRWRELAPLNAWLARHVGAAADDRTGA